jgi:hypothetical protein
MIKAIEICSVLEPVYTATKIVIVVYLMATFRYGQ